MQRQQFYYDLPESLIAKFPLAERTQSRLLCIEGATGDCQHKQFSDIEAMLQPGDLLVYNNTRVIPARMFGQKETGGKVEILIERLISDTEALAHTRSSKSPKPGAVLTVESGDTIEVTGRQDALFEIKFLSGTAMEVLDRAGHMPLPPYIDRADEESDQERYQTVYNKHPGAVAAPTAGLHFDDALLARLKEKGVETGEVTLHVGAGTFQPVKVDDINTHHMHSEWIEVKPELVEQVKAAKARGGRVIAVGTTSVRCLETAALDGALKPFSGDTEIFLYPGKPFHVVDCLITNFHLPESTLIMLVSAFAGYKHTMAAYKEAVANEYRFFSYGDAMFITKNPNAINEVVA